MSNDSLPENTKATLEELKAPETFDLGAVLESKVTYPTREVHVYLDAEAAQSVLEKADEITALLREKVKLEDEHKGGITGADTSEIDALVEEKTLEVQALGEKLEASALDFTLRGVGPKVWRAIAASWRHKIRDEKGDDEFTQREKNIERNEKVGIDTLRNAIVKITTADGKVSEGIPPFEQVENLYGTLFESEWYKLKNMGDELTFANELFQAVSADADFLPKSSLGDETEAI